MGQSRETRERTASCSACSGSLPVPGPERTARICCPSCKAWTYGTPRNEDAAPRPRRSVRRCLLDSLGWLGRLMFPWRRTGGTLFAKPNSRAVHIPLGSISTDEILPRRTLDLARQRMLERSVARFGVLVPVVVRPVGDGFKLVTGHRRLLAAQRIGLPVVPALVRRLSRTDAEVYRYLENSSADPPGPLEEAEAFERIFLQGPRVGRKLFCRRLGLDPKWISDRLELLSLPRVVQDALESRILDLEQARLVGRAGSTEDMFAWIERFSRKEARTADLMEYLSRKKDGGGGGSAQTGEDPLCLLDEALDEHLV